MTMHLEGPWLTTTGKRRGGRRYRTAEAAARAKHDRVQWNQLLEKYNIKPESNRGIVASVKLPTDPGRYRRDTGPRIPSADSGQGSTAAPASKQYTGTLIRGIATMHKSNAVPILDNEQARDVAHMRR